MIVHPSYFVYRRLPLLNLRLAIAFTVGFVSSKVHCLHEVEAMHSKATVSHPLPFKDAQKLLLIVCWELEELDEVCLIGEVGLD